MMPAAAAIAANDLRIYFRDRTAVLLGFLLPVGLIAVFGMVMGSMFGSTGGTPRFPLWVVDQDRSPRSDELLEALRQSELIRVKVPKAGGEADALSVVDDGEASHLLVIEAGYGAAPSTESLRLVRDPGRSLEDRVIGIALMQATASAGIGDGWSGRLRESFAGLGMEGPALDLIGRQSDTMNQTIQDWFDENPAASGPDAPAFDPMSFFTGSGSIPTQDVVPPDRPKNATHQLAQSVSGTAVMMLMFGLATCATVLVVERENGTMTRLLASSTPRAAILLGKAAFVATVGLLQMVVMLVAGELLFGIGTFREPISLLVLTLVWVTTSTALGLLIATASQTRKQAESWSPVIVLPLAALGGCWFPLQLANLPAAVDAATKATPTYWAMSAFQGYFWRGQSAWDGPVLTAMGIQMVMAVALAAAAAWAFRRNTLSG